MNERTIDVAVIGAGTAGLAAYRAARSAGRSAVIIESGSYGTTCARVGCMPSKLLIAAAEAAHATARLAQFGLRLPGALTVDGAAVMARVRSERDRFVGFVLEGVESIPAQDRIRGRARFVGPDVLMVDDDLRIRFGRAVIATGSSPDVLPFLRPLGDRVIVNDDVFAWDTLPESVAVIGPGVIGLELGQALHRLGVRVQMLGRGGIGGGLSDPEVRAYAQAQFGQEYPVDFDARISRSERVGDQLELEWTAGDGQLRQARFDYVLAATGRSPNVRNLGLETTGLAVGKDGVPLFDEGRIAGANAAAWPAVQSGLRRSRIAVVFSDPQLAVVGQGHADIDPAVRVIGQVSFEDQGRSRVMLRHRGLLRVYAHRVSRRFLGAEMIGPDAEHLAHLLAWAHQAGMTIDTMLDMPFYHPVVEEGLRTALRDTAAALDAAAAQPPARAANG